jgi:hypothetical protein
MPPHGYTNREAKVEIGAAQQAAKADRGPVGRSGLAFRSVTRYDEID